MTELAGVIRHDCARPDHSAYQSMRRLSRVSLICCKHIIQAGSCISGVDEVDVEIRYSL